MSWMQASGGKDRWMRSHDVSPHTFLSGDVESNKTYPDVTAGRNFTMSVARSTAMMDDVAVVRTLVGVITEIWMTKMSTRKMKSNGAQTKSTSKTNCLHIFRTTFTDQTTSLSMFRRMARTGQTRYSSSSKKPRHG